jgi:predicted RNA-binding protein with TRAM domain
LEVNYMVYSKYNRRRFEGEKPVNEGETYDIEIEATGAKGDGIGKIKGFVVIIPNAKPGQKLKVKIDALRGKVAFGSIVGEADPAPAEESAEEKKKEGAAEGETEEAPSGEAAEESSEAEEPKEGAEAAEEEPAPEEATEEEKAEEPGEEKKE